MPFFSVILPTYNSGNRLDKCLRSILQQDCDDFEILIIDSGSTDNTLQTINSFCSDKIKYFSEKDKGVYDAMNKGIGLSNGCWLYFIGSDDELYDHEVFSDVKRFVNGGENLNMVYGSVFFKEKKIVYSGQFDRVRLQFENICHQAIFYKRNVFDIVGLYNLRYIALADWDFNMRCFLHPDLNIQYYKRIISYYNDGSGVSNSLGGTDLLQKERIGFYIEKEKAKYMQSREYQIGYKVLHLLNIIKHPAHFFCKRLSFLKNKDLNN